MFVRVIVKACLLNVKKFLESKFIVKLIYCYSVRLSMLSAYTV